MTQYIVRRILSIFVVLFVVSLVTFGFMHLIPGNPFDSERNVPDQVIAQLEAKYNLDAPLHRQYLDYIGDITIPVITDSDYQINVNNDWLINVPLPGDKIFHWMNFGPSYKSPSRTVNDIFEDHLPVSFQLGIAALMVALVIGLPAGVISALNRNTWLDYASMGVAIVGVSVPVIVSGPILRYLFGVQLKWVPPTGWGSLENMILPAFALGFTSSALLARLTRASMLQVLNEDYIRTARAKGLHERTVITLHAMKNAMIPVVTVIGPIFAGLVTGSFVTEIIFGIPGLGSFFITSINNRDYPVIMGTTLMYAAFLVFSNLIVDITYAWLDPRISYS